MTVDAVSGSSTQNSASTQSAARLSDNFSTFLSLLTAQLQNQDPLSPMDSNQFTQQLVSYSQVEQAIQTNQNLESLISAQTAQSFSNMVGYLGKTVTMDTNATGLKDGSADWTYILGADAEKVTVVVNDSSGNPVFAKMLEGDALKKGEHTFSWDGVSDSGKQMPDGGYSLSVTAKTGESSIDTTTLVKGKVESVETVAGQHWLVVKGIDIPLGTLKKVSENSEEPASENPQGA
jgi:flagellar basal-body rod modification protein FlgD